MVVVAALLVLLAVASLGTYRDLEAARQRQDSLQQQIDATAADNEELSSQIRRLQEDPVILERVAREQYRMIRPGDVVIVLPEEQPTAPSTTDALP